MSSVSLLSLATGTQGRTVGAIIRATAEIASAPFLATFNRIDNGASYLTGLVFAYDEAIDKSREAEQQLTQLRGYEAQRREQAAENERLRAMLSFAREETQFTLMAASVIQHAGGMLTIDRGSLHGMRESLCVITAEGVIGYVTKVGMFTSSVITLQNADCRIDAMIGRNRVRGRVTGTGNDLTALCTMHYIDLKEDIREGDEVVTSPDSVFPSGYPLGRIKSVPKRGQFSQSADVVPTADPFGVDEVFVLLAFDREWQDLAGDIEAGASVDAHVDLAEMSSVQERYAP